MRVCQSRDQDGLFVDKGQYDVVRIIALHILRDIEKARPVGIFVAFAVNHYVYHASLQYLRQFSGRVLQRKRLKQRAQPVMKRILLQFVALCESHLFPVLFFHLGKEHTVILSSHILSEVQSVCDRIVIINEGKIIADEKTENITQVVEDNRRYAVKVAGPQREVAAALRQIPGVLFVEITGERELDSYVYRVEAEKGVDVRKPVFFAMAENNWPITGLETLGMNLEEVFTRIIDRAGN